MKEPKKRGVKSLLDDRPLTFAEAKQRQRTKDKKLQDAMWQRDYLPTRVFIHTKHLQHLSKLSFINGTGQFDLMDTSNLSAYLFKLIDEHLKQQGVIDDDLPTKSNHREAQEAATINFNKWQQDHIATLNKEGKK